MLTFHKFALDLATFFAVSTVGSAGMLYDFENVSAGTPVPFTDW